MNFWEAWLNTLQQWQWIGMLLARLSVGLLFTISGAGKLFIRDRRQQMRETLVVARVPAPKLSAVVVSSVELFFGTSLIAGFLTPLSCLLLIGVMLGALSTTVLPGLKANSVSSWLSGFLYLPEVLYIVILVWLLFSGPGWLSLDHLLLSSAGR